MQLGELIKNNNIDFHKYDRGKMYFQIFHFEENSYFTFPIPVADIPEHMNIYSTDRAIIALRWIRKAMENGTFVKKHLYD